MLDVLLDESADDGALRRAAHELYTFLADAAQLDESPGSPDWLDTQLPGGRALSPIDAARCTRDYRRTAIFLRGVLAALRSFPAPVEVLYAGSGPFGTILLPLLPLFAPGALRVTLLDIHERSCAAVGRVADRLGVDVTILCADATTYRHPLPIDVVVVETMQSALVNEPQVAVAQNLATQLAPDGVLVPESIELSLGVHTGMTAVLTRVVVLESYVLESNESAITLPRTC